MASKSTLNARNLERCDDSSGIVSGVFHDACALLGEIALAAGPPPAALADAAQWDGYPGGGAGVLCRRALAVCAMVLLATVWPIRLPLAEPGMRRSIRPVRGSCACTISVASCPGAVGDGSSHAERRSGAWSSVRHLRRFLGAAPSLTDRRARDLFRGQSLTVTLRSRGRRSGGWALRTFPDRPDRRSQRACPRQRRRKAEVP